MPPISLDPPSGRYLSFAEREEIGLLRATKCGVREIARRTGRSPSTISRELRLNAATRGGRLDYRASVAQWHADRQARRSKTSKLADNGRLQQYVQDRLGGAISAADGSEILGPQTRWIGRRHGRRQDRRWATSWSPEQIARRLPFDFRMMSRCASHTRPSTVPSTNRDVLVCDASWWPVCAPAGPYAFPGPRTRGRGKKFVTEEAKISQRPAETEDPAVPRR